ncbi:hypothetical protein HK102_006172, partial [Quaeritorhiza haematococci]
GYNINASINALAAIYVFIGVFFSKIIDWGRFYWIAIVCGYVVPAGIGSVPSLMGQVGDVGLVCNIGEGSVAGLYARIIPQFTAFFLCLILYISIYQKLRTITHDLKHLNIQISTGPSSSDDSDKQLLHQGALLIGFAFAYVVQWGQLTILQILSYAGRTYPPGAMISAVLFSNAGGFWTAC